MLFQVGEIAKKTGLTVRTLHHYEEIGLLQPTARTDAGYRLYDMKSIERLTQIQMLRQIGVKLKDIGHILNGHSAEIACLIEERISQLTTQMQQIAKLRYQLEHVQQQIQTGTPFTQHDWFSLLEMMSMYDKYFTYSELAQLPLYTAHTLKSQAWQQRISIVNNLIKQGKSADSNEAMQVSREWMIALEQDTGGNPDFFVRLNKMHISDDKFATATGITKQMIDFVAKGFSEYQLSVFKPHLTPEQFAVVHQHYFDAGSVWPELISGLYNALTYGEKADSEQVQNLAKMWLNMFNQFTQGDSDIQAKIRTIYQTDHEIAKGTWMTPEIGQYLFTAISLLVQK